MANQQREIMLENAWRAREAGKQAFVTRAPRKNPYPGFEGFCWDAGYNQDVRSIEQLAKAFGA